jgi:LytTr DNA-binding domain
VLRTSQRRLHACLYSFGFAPRTWAAMYSGEWWPLATHKPVAPAVRRGHKAAPTAGPDTSGAGFRKGGRALLVSSCLRYLPSRIRGKLRPLHFANERPLVCRSMATIEERLDPAVFFRAGRKCILNLKWVESVETGVGGNLIVRMRAGVSVELSRRQSSRFREALSL